MGCISVYSDADMSRSIKRLYKNLVFFLICKIIAKNSIAYKYLLSLQSIQQKL